MEIIDSMLLVLRSVRATVGGTPRRSTVNVSDRPSRSDAAAPGWARSSSLASASSWGLGGQGGLGVVGAAHLRGDRRGEPVGQPIGHVPQFVDLAPSDHWVV